MMKRIPFFIISLAIVVLFFAIPSNYNWLTGTILFLPVRYTDQFSHLDPDERRILRYGNSYVIYRQTVRVFEKTNIRNALILLPPNNYLKEMGVINFEVPEPAAFYYYTGFKSVWPNSPEVENANWTLVPKKPVVMLRRIHGREDIEGLLKIYKPYMPAE